MLYPKSKKSNLLGGSKLDLFIKECFQDGIELPKAIDVARMFITFLLEERTAKPSSILVQT